MMKPWRLTKKTVKIKTNTFNVPLIPQATHEKLFGSSLKTSNASDTLITDAENHLEKCNIEFRQSENPLQTTFPSFEGLKFEKDIESHFKQISSNQIKPYQNGLKAFLSEQIPKKPTKWAFQAGWTKYDYNSKSGISVQHPEEDILVFDIELCVSEGPWPIMATAVSNKAWYSWCSPYLIDTSLKPQNKTCLSKRDMLEIGHPLIVIGHNVSFDRARISEQYDLKLDRTRFLDTMALHTACCGMTSGQRMVKQKLKAMNKKKLPTSEEEEFSDENSDLNWLEVTAMNALDDVYEFYTKKSLFKKKRDVFVTGNLNDILDDFQSLMTYCATDVQATQEVFSKVYPKFLKSCPHPVTLSGLLTMSTAYLPTSPSMFKYVESSDKVKTELENDVDYMIKRQAKEACQLSVHDKFQEDIWLWNLDWSMTELKMKKGNRLKNPIPLDGTENEIERLEKLFMPLLSGVENFHKFQPRCPGYPRWYSDLCGKSYDPYRNPEPELRSGMKIVPKLLRLTWNGSPLFHTSVRKWGYLVKNADAENHIALFEEMGEDIDTEELGKFPLKAFCTLTEKISAHRRNSTNAKLPSEPKDFGKKPFKNSSKAKESFGDEDEIPIGCDFEPLPHPSGKGHVGNPLSKAFLDQIQTGVLSTYSEDPQDSKNNIAQKIHSVSKSLSYWKSNHDRIRNQIIVQASENDTENLAIIPMIVTAGTLTRRAVEKTWLTASNARADRVGSELKAMVKAPKGHIFVGADVDSQELWIAAVLGDAYFTREHGSTALGWMTLQGTKSQGTDMHSKTAQAANVSRDEAKILNYGRIYGAGIKFATQLLRNFNPRLSESEAMTRAAEMYKLTKGERHYILSEKGRNIWKLLHEERNVITEKEMKAFRKTAPTLDEMLESYSDPNALILKEDFLTIAESLAVDVGPNNEITEKNLSTLLVASLRSRKIKGFDIPKDLYEKVFWKGGTESFTFNKLEEIALSKQARTPVLNCKITDALTTWAIGNDYLPSRINWVVQSSAVDYLHLLLSAMQWLFEELEINGRFAISIHDEVRYIVKNEDAYKAAFALQVANMMVRAMFSQKLNMNSMPLNVAFFSGVDIDQVMRKEPFAKCVTPSNPSGLEHGYGVPVGECLTIDDILKRLENTQSA